MLLLLLTMLGVVGHLVVLKVLVRASTGAMPTTSWLIGHWSDSFIFSCIILRASNFHEVAEGSAGFRRVPWRLRLDVLWRRLFRQLPPFVVVVRGSAGAILALCLLRDDDFHVLFIVNLHVGERFKNLCHPLNFGVGVFVGGELI